MLIISLKQKNKIQFLQEISQINFKDNLMIKLNTNSIENFETLIKYLIIKKIKKINFSDYKQLKNSELKNFKENIRKYYLTYIKHINIIFKENSNLEIKHLLKERNYLNYCNINKLIPNFNEEKKQEIKKLENFKKLKKYQNFKILSNELNKIPFSNFNFTNEKNLERFIFYLHIYSEKSQKYLINLIQKLDILNKNEIIKNIKNNKINQEVFYYGLGFSYENNKLKRFTLYCSLANKKIKNNFKKYILYKHNLKLKIKIKNPPYYAIDYFENNKINFKIYDEPYNFNENLDNKKLEKIFNNKKCSKVSKFENNKIIAIKYEFNFKNNEFNKNEKNYLEKNNLYNKNTKILAIYIKDKKITKKVLYYI